ncbi:beta strand repeat-containing protein, partial [Marinomonas pollencensis]|uniref:beta strand repeat-containing protein n=1 Tax=Marinomonas pollencensis TaxID=491954 RepID=UPI000E243BC3
MSDSQTSFATLGSPIGTITQITGSVVVKSIDGNERVVQVGDPIFYGETVITGAEGSATIKFVDGSEVVIGGDSVVVINDEVYTPDDVDGLAQDSSTDAEALQQAIADGADPTLIQDAPAAGEETIGEQQRVDVDVERNQEGALPNFGFETDQDLSLPSYGYDTDNSFSPLSSNTQTSSTSNSTSADNSADLDNNLSVTVSASDLSTNASEASNVSVTLSGVDSDASQVSVVFSDGSNSVTTNATQNGAGNWVVADTDISSLNDGTVSVTTTVTDTTGNTAQSQTALTLDQTITGSISVSDVTEDDIVSAAEGETTIAISGIVTGDAQDGDVVTLTINGKEYTGEITNRTFSIDVDGQDLIDDPDRNIEASVTFTDDAGNTLLVTSDSHYEVDTTADLFGDFSVSIAESDSVANLEESSDVTVTLDGIDRDADTVTVVFSDGTNSVSGVATLVNDEWVVSDTDISGLTDGTITVTATVTDDAGNTATATDSLDLDTSADTDSNFAVVVTETDQLANADEVGSVNVTFTGVDGDIESISVTFSDGDSSTADVVAEAVLVDGVWTVDADLSSLSDGNISISATATDDAGNTVTETSSLELDTSADTDDNFSVAVAEGDAVTNADEADSVSVTLSGVDDDAETVTVTFSDGTNNVVVDATQTDGVWTVADANLSDLTDGEITVTALATDDAGNTVETTDTLDLDTSADTDDNFTVAVSDTDAVTNADEADSVNVALSGVDDDAQSVVVTFSDGDETTADVTVNATKVDGVWTVADADLSDLTDGEITVTALATDDAGNTVETTDTLDLDTSADTDDNFSVAVAEGDAVTNADEADSVSVTLSGVDDDAETVTVTFSDGTNNVVVDATKVDGTWTVADANLSDLTDGEITVTALATDDAGNTVETTDTLDLDTSADTDENFAVNVVTSDEVTNADEADSVSVTLSGVDDDAQSVVVTFSDGDETTADVTVNATKVDGVWTVADADLSDLTDGEITVTALATDDAGNTVETADTLDLDTSADTDDNFSVAVAEGDAVTNADEADSVSVTLSGVDDDAETVTVTFSDGTNNVVVDATQTDGVWTVADADLSELTDGEITVTALATDDAGNTVETTDTLDLDTSADTDENFAVNVVTSDEVTNADEADSVSVTLSGVDDDAQSVVVTFSDGDETTADVTVNATKVDGVWTVADANLSDLTDGEITVTALATDDAGNTVETTDTLDLDTSADTDDNFSVAVAEGDAVTNADEADSVNVTLSGVDDDAQSVVVTFSDGDETTADVTVNATKVDGTWTVADADLSDLTDGEITVTALATDDAGNIVETTDTLDLDTTAGTISINAVATDNQVDDSEDNSVTLSGSTDGIEAGQTVSVSVVDANGAAVYSGTVEVDENGDWSIEGVDMSGFADEASYTVKADVSDAAGNAATQATQAFTTEDTTAGTISINAVATDNQVDDSEDNSVTLSGSTDGIEAGQTVSVSVVDANGAAVYSGTVEVDENGDWSIEGVDMSGFADEASYTVKADVSDAAGNAATQATQAFTTEDTTAP